MSLYFLVNNLHFAFGMVGAIILSMSAWLTLDSYKVQKSTPILLRFVGLVLFAIWQIIQSLDIKNDLLLYFGYALLIIGLFFVVFSFLKTKQLVVNSIVVIPAFTLWVQQLSVISTILFLGIGYLALRQWKKEFNNTWIPFGISFLLLGFAYFLNIFDKGVNYTSIIFIVSNLVEFFGFIALGVWVWQYMRLRISESMMMILIGATFLLSTMVTLAFSTILINRVVTETSNNLLTDVKVLDFSMSGMKEEALAKTILVSVESDLVKAVERNDLVLMDQLAGLLLEKYKLGFLIITDKNGEVLVRGHSLSRRGDSLVGERALEEALIKNPIVTIEDSKTEGFSMRAGSPIYSKDKIIGSVIAGFPLDNVLADKMKKLTGLEMFIYKDDKSIAGTALAADGRTRLVGNTVNNNIKVSVLSSGKTITSSSNIYDTQFHASYMPLYNADEKIVGMISVAKPQQDIINIANATNRLTLITVLAILLVLMFPIYFISKKVGENI